MMNFYKKWFLQKTSIFALALFALLAIPETLLAQGYVTLGTQSSGSGNYSSSPVNGFYESRKIQVIYTAAELTAGGGIAGNIEKLAWDVSVLHSEGTGFDGYTIGIKHITGTAIPTGNFETGITTVKNSTYTYVPALGFNDITFDTPFNWDGTSNILVEVCFYPVVYSASDVHGECWMYAGATDSYVESEVDLATTCSDAAWLTQSSSKPRVRFYMNKAVATCDVPTTFTRYNVQTTSAVVSWTNPAAGSPASYYIEVRTSGAAGSGATGLVSTFSVTHPTNVATLTGLTANTAYAAYVRTNCGGSGNSSFTSAASFTTQCNPTNIPYTQNFTATVPNLPSCTSVEDVNGSVTWRTVAAPVAPSAPTGFFTGTTLVYTYESTGTVAANDWFYTTGLNLTLGQEYRVKYKYGARSGPVSIPEKLRVCYGTSPASTSMLTTLTDHNNITAQSNSAKVDFTAPSTGAFYFGFQAYSVAGSDRLYLDDIEIDVKPICSDVTNKNITNITPTSASLTWTVAPANTPPGTPANYLIELRTSGTPGSGSSGLVTSLTTTAATAVTNFTSLTASTTYTAYIRTDCGAGDYSAWSSAINFTTLCDPGAVSDLLASNITNSTAKASFISSGGAPTIYEFELRTSGAAGSGATGLVTSLTLTHPTSFTNLSSLTSNTEYTFYVRSKCVSGNMSTWQSYTFKTLCDPQNVPYTENFNGATPPSLPSCVTRENLAGSSTDWEIFDANPLTLNNFLTNAAYFGYDGSNSANNWLYTAGINLTAGTNYVLSYSIIADVNNTTRMGVSYGSYPSGASMLTTLTNHTSIPGQESGPNSPGLNSSVTFSPSTTGVYYIGFNAKDIGNSHYILLDNVSLTTAPLNSNSSLSNLSTSPSGTLSPAFLSSTFNYTVTLPFGSTGGATLLPTVAAGTSTTSITSATNVAGSAPANVASVVVTAQNGATSTYTVTFNLGTANTNSSLATLTTSVGTLSPTFSAGTFNYTVTLPYGTTGGATLTATTAAGTSTRVITNASDVAGASPANVASVVVTAQNGSTSTYTVTYNITPASTDATLMSLTPSTGTLMPAFSPSVTSYTVNMPEGSSGFADLTGVVNSSFASITSNLGALEISSSDPIDNTASITVTAQDGSTLTYYVSFIIGVGINENVANSIIASVYPNPTNGLTTLKVNNTNSSTIKVSVVSISGQVVSEKEIKTNNQETNYEINLSNQPKGVYFVKIKTNETTLVKRVIAY